MCIYVARLGAEPIMRCTAISANEVFRSKRNLAEPHKTGLTRERRRKSTSRIVS